MTNVLIYEDNENLRDGLTILLNSVDNFKIVGAFKNCDKIKKDIEELDPQLVLMDIDMPGIGGIEGLKLAKGFAPEVKILMLTVFEDNQNVFEALRQGADGYILKKTPTIKIIEYINDALTGGAPMTPSIARMVLQSFNSTKTLVNTDDGLSSREKEVLKLLVEGFSYKMIAGNLIISVDTVRSHIKRIYEKLQVNSKSQAVAKAIKGKIV